MDLVKPFIENILYPAMESRKGNRVRHNVQMLKSSQNLSQAQVQDLQRDKLKKLLLECIDNVPAYQSYRHLRSEIEADSFTALNKFQVLDKSTFKKSSEDYFNQKVSKDALIANRTGGSTSEPVKFYIDRHTVEFYEAARWRGLSYWGITPGSRSVMIWGNPMELSQAAQRKYRLKEQLLKNRIMIPAYSLNPNAMKAYLQQIIKFKPEYFYGYASALHAFSTLMQQQSLRLPFIPKAVVSTAETLHDFQREAIEKAFACPVVNEYGARDGGILAYECPQGSMHISAENAIIEVVDYKTLKPVPLGCSGLLLVTDLNNFSMPRLRYQLGDRGALSKETCTCNLSLPLLDKIDGREDDMFVTTDGRLIHGHAFNHISRSMDAVQKFQIIQKSPAYAELCIVRNPNGNGKELDQFIHGAKELLPGSEIEIKFVDDIPTSGSGKFRYAIRQFPL